ncbi:MAG: DUF1566 domain-containing protein [Cryomorphaceae bacterium]|nr:MAG: DUF1566 domain-containing protein [Cryomorphaceae bacterium]
MHIPCISYPFVIVMMTALILFSACSKDEEETDPVGVPEVSTLSAEPTGIQTALAVGEVMSDGGSPVSERGICLRTGLGEDAVITCIASGEGVGTFSVEAPFLEVGKIYSVYAYAKNEAGTGYGNQISLTTVMYQTFVFQSQLFWVFPFDQNFAVWGPNNQFVGATNPSNGLLNTMDISGQVVGNTAAAKVCNNLSAYGMNDWYLPSRNELLEMYNKREEIGNFGEESYWTSTEVSASHAEAIDFTTGEVEEVQKNVQLRCRCIRRD